MVLEDWGVGHAAVEVLHSPSLSTQRFLKNAKTASKSTKSTWTEQWREADGGSCIWVRLSPHTVSGGCQSDWRVSAMQFVTKRCLALEMSGKPSFIPLLQWELPSEGASEYKVH